MDDHEGQALGWGEGVNGWGQTRVKALPTMTQSLLGTPPARTSREYIQYIQMRGGGVSQGDDIIWTRVNGKEGNCDII